MAKKVAEQLVDMMKMKIISPETFIVTMQKQSVIIILK